MGWGPEKMLIRCNKESHYPAEWALGLRLSSPGERERHNADGHKFGGQNIAVMFDLQLPLTVKPHTTFSNPCNKVRGNICIKKSSCVRLSFSLRQYVSCMNMYMRIQQKDKVNNIELSKCSLPLIFNFLKPFNGVIRVFPKITIVSLFHISYNILNNIF